MRALLTYKDNSWIREIAEQLMEEFDDFHYIKARRGEVDLLAGEGEIQGNYDTLIRLGTYGSYAPTGDKEYNVAEGIKTASNKLKSRKKFEENFIPTPKTYSKNDLRSVNFEDLNYPLVLRDIKHHGGQNVRIINDEYEMEDSYYSTNEKVYYSEFYPKTKEYRVHIASGKAIIVAEKVVEEEKQDNVIWNLGDEGVCEEFKTLRWSEYREVEQVIKTASLACKSVGLDYGAVDVVAYPNDRQDELPPVAVLEVNTAPRLEEYGISRYVQYFKWLLMSNEKVEFKLPHELDRFSFTNNDFEELYSELEEETPTTSRVFLEGDWVEHEPRELSLSEEQMESIRNSARRLSERIERAGRERARGEENRGIREIIEEQW